MFKRDRNNVFYLSLFFIVTLSSLLILKVVTKMALHTTVSKKRNTNYETQET